MTHTLTLGDFTALSSAGQARGSGFLSSHLAGTGVRPGVWQGRHHLLPCASHAPIPTFLSLLYCVQSCHPAWQVQKPRCLVQVYQAHPVLRALSRRGYVQPQTRLQINRRHPPASQFPSGKWVQFSSVRHNPGHRVSEGLSPGRCLPHPPLQTGLCFHSGGIVPQDEAGGGADVHPAGWGGRGREAASDCAVRANRGRVHSPAGPLAEYVPRSRSHADLTFFCIPGTRGTLHST